MARTIFEILLIIVYFPLCIVAGFIIIYFLQTLFDGRRMK